MQPFFIAVCVETGETCGHRHRKMRRASDCLVRCHRQLGGSWILVPAKEWQDLEGLEKLRQEDVSAWEREVFDRLIWGVENA